MTVFRCRSIFLSCNGNIAVYCRCTGGIAEAVADIRHRRCRVAYIPRFPIGSHTADPRNKGCLSLFSRGQLTVYVDTAAGNGNAARIIGIRFIVITCAISGGSNIAVDGNIPICGNGHGGAVKLRCTAQRHIAGNSCIFTVMGLSGSMGIDGKRPVTVDHPAEIAAATGSHEVIQREPCAVHRKPRSIIDSEILPVKCQRIRIRIRIDNGKQRIISRAVLDRINAGHISFLTEIFLRIRQERIQNRRGTGINAPVRIIGLSLTSSIYFSRPLFLCGKCQEIRTTITIRIGIRTHLIFSGKFNGLIGIILLLIDQIIKRFRISRTNIISICKFITGTISNNALYPAVAVRIQIPCRIRIGNKQFSILIIMITVNCPNDTAQNGNIAVFITGPCFRLILHTPESPQIINIGQHYVPDCDIDIPGNPADVASLCIVMI